MTGHTHMSTRFLEKSSTRKGHQENPRTLPCRKWPAPTHAMKGSSNAMNFWCLFFLWEVNNWPADKQTMCSSLSSCERVPRSVAEKHIITEDEEKSVLCSWWNQLESGNWRGFLACTGQDCVSGEISPCFTEGFTWPVVLTRSFHLSSLFCKEGISKDDSILEERTLDYGQNQLEKKFKDYL